jgi:hypothetical protein
MILLRAKRLRHKEWPSYNSQILFIPFPFCFQHSRREEGFLFSLFLLQNSFFSNRLKLMKHETLDPPFISHGTELGDTAKEKKHPQ